MDFKPLKDNMRIDQAAELVAYCHFDGKIEQESKFEIEINNTVIDQICNSDISGRCLALSWIFFKAHSRLPLGQFLVSVLSKVPKISNFNQNDFKDAVTLLLLNDKSETNVGDLELKKLISMQFDNDSEMKFWVTDLFDQVYIHLI